MSDNVQTIDHPDTAYFIAIRDDYLLLCQDAPDMTCAAVILDRLENFTDLEVGAGKQNLWFRIRIKDWQYHLYWRWGRNKVFACLAWLADAEWIQRRRSPVDTRDKAWQFKLNISQINTAIRAQSHPSTISISKSGYIYLLRAITPHNHYKIGLSRNPAARIDSLAVKLPFPIEPIHQFPTNHRFKAEKALHDRYADKRINGEWFELSDCDVQDICAIERMNIEGVQDA